jgi:hypothetical protein
MALWSMVTTKVPADRVDSSIAALIKRRSAEESAETSGEQNDAGMHAIDGVTPLAFHAVV